MKNKLKDYRKDAELSQEDLAKAVGVSRQSINAIERGRYDPSLELAFKLSEYFDCQIGDLFEPDIQISED